jgi:chromosome segregation ATPase
MPPKKDADSQLSEANARLQTARDDAATFCEETLTKWHEKLIIEQKLVDANTTILRLEKRDNDTQKQLQDLKEEVEEMTKRLEIVNIERDLAQTGLEEARKHEHEVKKREETVKKREEAVKKREEDGSGNDVASEDDVPVKKRKQVRTRF